MKSDVWVPLFCRGDARIINLSLNVAAGTLYSSFSGEVFMFVTDMTSLQMIDFYHPD